MEHYGLQRIFSRVQLVSVAVEVMFPPQGANSIQTVNDSAEHVRGAARRYKEPMES
jgi:hypothetical protein